MTAVGGYLADKPRDILYELARSENLWHRRIAMFSTMHFIRQGDLDDTFAIAEILVRRPRPHTQGHRLGTLHHRRRRPRPTSRLPRPPRRHRPPHLLRAAIENLPEDERRHYMALKKARSTSS